ncbi:ATP-dependent DNA ligase [Streptomyces sp. WAC05458]|nr:ATP-dependent DNA ligase [Streptomyces sp. WAC05458]
MVEVDVDVPRDGAGRWRHPVRLHRTRPDVSVYDVPPFESGTTG